MNAMLHGRVAMVTGAGRADGIGFAAARALARYGADVVVTDLTGRRPDLSMAAIHEVVVGPDDLEHRAEELRGMNVGALASQFDVTDASNVADCVARTERELGRIDILYNNAGIIAGAGPFLETTESAWDLQYRRVHVQGAAALCRAVMPVMIRGGGGSIVNMSSNWAVGPRERSSIYASTKLGVIGLTRVIAIEHGRDNIRCNAILPGPIRTTINDSRARRMSVAHGVSEDEAREMMAAPLAPGRVGRPKEIAFLASDMSSFVTGVALRVDGREMEGL